MSDLFRMTMYFVPFVDYVLWLSESRSDNGLRLSLELLLHFVPVRRLFIAETAAG